MNALTAGLASALLPLATDSDASLALLLVGPAGAAGLYWGIYQYYRNTKKSHAFEKETLIEAQPVTGSEQKVDTVRGTKRTKIQGDNVSEHRSRVERLN